MRRLPLLVLLCAACDQPPTGSLVSRGGTLGDFTFAPDRCVAGTTREFLGADLFDPGGRRGRALADPIWGDAFSYGTPESPSLLLGHQSDCSSFEMAIHYDRCGACGKNDTDEDDETVSGWLRLDCATPGGGRIAGAIDFPLCLNQEEQ